MEEAAVVPDKQIAKALVTPVPLLCYISQLLVS